MEKPSYSRAAIAAKYRYLAATRLEQGLDLAPDTYKEILFTDKEEGQSFNDDEVLIAFCLTADMIEAGDYPVVRGLYP